MVNSKTNIIPSVKSIPVDVAVLTAAIDIRADRFEIEIVGWCKGCAVLQGTGNEVDYRLPPHAIVTIK
ncbi:hypothetical protein FS594_15660 [Rahnella aquatilis]|uniref:terminase gpA endonuclease subunit n=1 Tax=Rahnella sp. CFA14(1/10) TaxID=2511203 RepID=UPI0010219933|nr:terminase gpA endonuclease subunit [Rahnella sp. CFA14(1/10)]UJD90097.1 hypothetical protein FS594_15660 [Rahnella aquatilis]